MLSSAKKITPPIIAMPARKNGGYLDIRYFVHITQVSVKIIAASSKKFPSRGFGASSDASELKLKNTDPSMEINKPEYTILINRSFNIILAAITKNTGSRELTIPAWPDVVYLSAFVSKIKYKQGSHKTIKATSHISLFFILICLYTVNKNGKNNTEETNSLNVISWGAV